MPRFAHLALAALFSSICSAATPVILISVDTLRADHVSSYRLGANQTGKHSTPHIDSLARNGTLFSQVSTPYPLTLPAHVAMFTSSYPFANGVMDNGVPLPDGAATLATVLKAAGYRTAAFLGSFVLDRRFGLSRGFDVYDSPFDLHNKTAVGVGDRKRPGAQVAEAATHWLENNSNAPFFLFLHLYDLHAPYDLPADPAQRHGETGYSAELAYVDRIIGDFLQSLDRQGLLQKALIVFTSDHGEGLEEHGESSHGYFVYQSTLHVPLIFHWPAGSARRVPQERVDAPAGLLDVAPTILDAIGLARPAVMRGRSLLAPATSGDSDIYSESTYARNHFGAAALRALRQGAFKYIDAPRPELYDLSSDPGETRNLYTQQRPQAMALHDRIVIIRGHAANPAGPAVSPETSRILRSLGYLSGSTAGHVESHVDPKDRIADFERYVNALASAAAGRLAEATAVLTSLRDKLPDVVDIRTSLGLNQQRLGDNTLAAREFKRAAELDPANAAAHFELGSCYYRASRRSDAIAQFKTALALAPWYTRADEALADIYLQGKDYPQARAHLEHLASVDPDSYTAHFNLGTLAAMDQNWSEAEGQMLSALHADPGSAEAHNTLGGIYLQRGQLEPAQHQFEEAIRLQAKLASAHYNLALVYQKQGKNAEALDQFRAAKSADR